MQRDIMQTPDFIGVKEKYNIFFDAIENVKKQFPEVFLVDFTGKALIVYHLKKEGKGFRKVKSASYFVESISDDYYKKHFKSIDDAKKSLSNLIISRLNLGG